MHHQGVGRRGEGRGEAHAGAQGDGEEEGVGTAIEGRGRTDGDGGHEDGGGGIAHEEGEDGGGQVDARQQSQGSELSQGADQAVGDERRGTRLGQGDGHGEHGADEHDALPVDGFVGGLHIAEAARQHHGHSGEHDGGDGGYRDEVAHHEDNHGEHDEGGNGGFVVEGDAVGHVEGAAQEDKVVLVVVETANLRPCAVHQEDVAVEQTQVGQVVAQVAALAAHGQHVDAILGAQARLAHAAAHQTRGRHEQDFGDARVVKTQAAVGIVAERQSVVGGEAADVGIAAREVEGVAALHDGGGAGGLLADAADEEALARLAAHLNDAHAIAGTQVKAAEALMAERRRGGDGDMPHLFAKAVFADQLAEALAAFMARVVVRVVAYQPAAQRVEGKGADSNADEAHGGEREERQRSVAALGEVFLDDEVGRRTDEGEHTAHAAGEGQGHEQTARVGAGAGGHADHDGEHQGHGARIADEGADEGRAHDDEEKQAALAVARQTHQAAADTGRQTRAENGPADDEKANHHDDDGVGEAGQGFFGREDAREQQKEEGAEGHDVRTQTSRSEAYGRGGKDEEGDEHFQDKTLLGI